MPRPHPPEFRRRAVEPTGMRQNPLTVWLPFARRRILVWRRCNSIPFGPSGVGNVTHGVPSIAVIMSATSDRPAVRNTCPPRAFEFPMLGLSRMTPMMTVSSLSHPQRPLQHRSPPLARAGGAAGGWPTTGLPFEITHMRSPDVALTALRRHGPIRASEV